MDSNSPVIWGIVWFFGSLLHLIGGLIFDIESAHGRVADCLNLAMLFALSGAVLTVVSGGLAFECKRHFVWFVAAAFLFAISSGISFWVAGQISLVA